VLTGGTGVGVLGVGAAGDDGELPPHAAVASHAAHIESRTTVFNIELLLLPSQPPLTKRSASTLCSLA